MLKSIVDYWRVPKFHRASVVNLYLTVKSSELKLGIAQPINSGKEAFLLYPASKVASFAMLCTSGVARVAFIFFLNFFSVLSLTVNSGFSTIVA